MIPTHLKFTCSKTTIGTLEKGKKYVQCFKATLLKSHFGMGI